jgi:outer membrane protein assembly factor BamE
MSPTVRIAPCRRVGLERAAALLAALAAAAALAGCGSSRPGSSGMFEPYRIDLPQGNYLTREMLDQVRPGSTRDQVRAVLGVPLLSPLFRPDRWDYVFRYQHPNGKAEVRRVVIRFTDDRVAAIDADELPEREDPNDPLLPGARPAAK